MWTEPSSSDRGRLTASSSEYTSSLQCPRSKNIREEGDGLAVLPARSGHGSLLAPGRVKVGRQTSNPLHGLWLHCHAHAILTVSCGTAMPMSPALPKHMHACKI